MRYQIPDMYGVRTVTPKQAVVALGHIHQSTELKGAVAQADVVIEAVSENLELKQDIFQTLDQSCPIHTILASNTSSLMPSILASANATS